jgi:hypothetical protein
LIKHAWLTVNADDLRIEKQQLLDEGKDISSVEGEFRELEALLQKEDELKHRDRIDSLLDRAAALPMRKDYSFVEPSDLAGIQQARPAGPRDLKNNINESVLRDKVLGAWLGRCSGCLLGKPVEGWRSERIWGYLKDTGGFPLNNYFRYGVSPDIQKKYEIVRKPWSSFIDLVDHMVEDDDTNYTVTGLAILKKHGAGFTPDDVANFWLENIPLLHTCTAERVAYKNFSRNVWPPQSAVYRNVYREWIGAQIRGDFFGYVALGQLERAAEFAWRDASISHTKNGIYGEMWVAAMLAAAPFLEDPQQVILAGLGEVPEKSRLAADVKEVVGWHGQGLTLDKAIQNIHQRWDEKFSHHWCHTNSNAQIVSIGLLWGEGDLEKSICGAVQAAFDTDCNGATVGSVVGMMGGAKSLPDKWIKPLNDRLDTGVAGYNQVKISDLAEEGFEIYKGLKEKA